MNDQLIAAIVAELAPALAGRMLGKVWQLSRVALAFDFRLSDGRYLFISVDPAAPRLYAIARTVRELEKLSLAPSSFVQTMRKQLGGARLLGVKKDEGERVVRFSFASYDAVGDTHDWTLIAQLTGRAANLLLLDAAGRVVDALRTPRGEGQEIADIYQPPPPPPVNINEGTTPARRAPFERGAHDSLSDAADAYYRALEQTRAFDARAAAHRTRLRSLVEKQKKLRRNLEKDLDAHGDAAEHKRVGDLLLSNIANAERHGSRVRVTDYFAEDAPTIELEIDEHASLQEEAARRFARYTKAKRAAEETTARLEELDAELVALERRQQELERIIAARDAAALEAFDEKARGAVGGAAGSSRAAGAQRGGAAKDAHRTKAQIKAAEQVAGARRYRSSDGYEILIGRAAKDNDQLTFKVARAHDLWLHAADYPGSHVIVRNPARGADVPHRTIIEAAQLAAYFSQAKRDAKVSVHYTPRKFLSKPKGAAPGLVRMSSFRTLLVEPREGVERI
ncbi:MAG TPA: NFACT RNA binding domain-containing protein [Pyrinomonadaceae bacterium]|jgi:predicted ribosome quality control (RQC) complex YloA/Tae2 family protein|nr:NFACT RNA binding domain-containing protein [Pyrinomonadaceae bacterium]